MSILTALSPASVDNQPDNKNKYYCNANNSQNKPNRDKPKSRTVGNYIATALLPGDTDYNLVISKIMFIWQSVNILTYTIR